MLSLSPAFCLFAIDQNGVMDFGGADRINWTTNDVVYDASRGAQVRRTQSLVWDTLNVNTPRLVSCSEAAVNGLTNWQTSYRDAGTPVVS